MLPSLDHVRVTTTVEQRFTQTLELHRMGVEMKRQQLMRVNPSLGGDAIARLLSAWLIDADNHHERPTVGLVRRSA